MTLNDPRPQYVGFSVNEKTREYRLRVSRLGEDACQFTVAIPNQAFLDNRVRYQDGPEICFLKLQRAIEATGGENLPASRMTVTNAELEEYRTAHAPKPNKNRPTPFTSS